MASWCLLLCLCAGLLIPATGVVVNTRHGSIRGSVVTLNDGQQVASFKGVPFAKPPIGDLRFAKPETVENWNGTLNCTEFRSSCGGGTTTHPDWNDIKEDCLHLNIYTPHPVGNETYPVMVYYYGGAYSSGSNIMYPGHFYAVRGVIVVVANYRVGAIGFASTGDDVARGNWGLWDQRESLVFVRDNIEFFGGNPNKVTIFGQSAGASSAGFHILSPKSEGLFHQALMISGTDMSPWAYNPRGVPPEEYTRQIARQLSCPVSPSQDMITCLRGKTFDQIRNANVDNISGYISLGFAPVIDGPDGILPDDPYKLREQGRFNKNIKVMAGHTSEDGTTYLLPFVPEAMDRGWNRSEHYNFIRNRMISWVLARDPEGTREYMSRAMQYFFTDWPYDEEPEHNRDQLRQAVTDIAYGVGLDYSLKSHAQYNETYEYLFAYLGCPHYHILPEWFGVIHGIGDLPFHWGWCQAPDHPEVLRDSKLDFMTVFPWTDTDKRFSNYSITLFSNFAKYGNPTPEPLPAPGGETEGHVTWEPFTNERYRYIYIGNDKVEMRENLNQKNNAFWLSYADWIVFTRNSTLTGPEDPYRVDLATRHSDKIMREMYETAKTSRPMKTNHPTDPECDNAPFRMREE